jgi:hypothetical protein
VQDERRRPSSEDAADTGRWSSQEPQSGAVRRSRTQSDITSPLDAPPIEDLTRPEVHLPVDVPPDDLTEMHSVYGGGDDSSVSLPNEAPFGAHQAPEADDLRIDAWPDTQVRPSSPPPPRSSTPSGPIVSPKAGAVTRVRTRTIAVEEDPTSGWSMPEARQATMPPPSMRSSTPPSVIVATASTPPSVMVSPSLTPPGPVESWAPPQPVAWPAPAPAPPQGPRMTPPRPFGTVEMNLQVMQGVPTPVPFAPPSPPSVRPNAPPEAKKGGVSAGVWVLIAVALLACGAMIAYGRLRG